MQRSHGRAYRRKHELNNKQISLTRFPDISRLSRQVVTLTHTLFKCPNDTIIIIIIIIIIHKGDHAYKFTTTEISGPQF